MKRQLGNYTSQEAQRVRRVAVTSRGPAQGADSARAASGVATAAGLLQLLECPRPGSSGSFPGPSTSGPAR